MDFGQLISLEQIEDTDGHDDIDQALRQDEKQLQDRLGALKKESSARFVRRWDEIISKYSQIDDNTQSDEIDLRTGQIVTDNGHLRSLATDGSFNGVQFQPSIWSGEYDFERVIREEEKEYRRQKRAKNQLKSKLKLQLLFQSTTAKSVLDSVPQVLADNLLILSPSPTKKRRLVASSPIKKIHSERKYSDTWGSPQSISFTSSPENQDSHTAFFRSSPIKRGASLPTTAGLIDSPVRSFGNTGRFFGSAARSIDDESDTEPLFLMISDLVETPRIAIFHCALGCRFVAESKATYKAHLLTNHSGLLSRIGYPVRPDPISAGQDHITELAILRLTLHFPLRVKIPQTPIVCGLNVEGGTCSRLFLNHESAQAHKLEHPSNCSSKLQVLSCPILGCEYLTDGGFSEWREHTLTHADRRQDSFIGSVDDLENISDMFSDSVSSINFSDEKESTPNGEARTPVKSQDSTLLLKPIHSPDHTQKPRQFGEDLPLYPHRNSTVESFDIRSDDSGDETSMVDIGSGYDSLDDLFQD